MKSMNASLITAGMIACLSVWSSPAHAAQKGQDFPDSTCTCKGCGKNPQTGGKTDVTGQCATVCKDKTVYDKGSEPHDYCKAALVRAPRVVNPDAMPVREPHPKP